MLKKVKCALCGAEGEIELRNSPIVIICEKCFDGWKEHWYAVDESHEKKLWNRFFCLFRFKPITSDNSPYPKSGSDQNE